MKRRVFVLCVILAMASGMLSIISIVSNIGNLPAYISLFAALICLVCFSYELIKGK